MISCKCHRWIFPQFSYVPVWHVGWGCSHSDRIVRITRTCKVLHQHERNSIIASGLWWKLLLFHLWDICASRWLHRSFLLLWDVKAVPKIDRRTLKDLPNHKLGMTSTSRDHYPNSMSLNRKVHVHGNTNAWFRNKYKAFLPHRPAKTWNIGFSKKVVSTRFHI